MINIKKTMSILVSITLLFSMQFVNEGQNISIKASQLDYPTRATDTDNN